MATSGLRYFGTNDEVCLGDRVEVRGWFRKFRGHVSYIPGISPKHRELEYEDVKKWAITSDGGTVYAMGFDPDHFQPPKAIRLLGRTEGLGLLPTDKLL
jgi:hypothetical protein